MYKNHEGYPDPTQGEAIREADKLPAHVSWFIYSVKVLASFVNLEVISRIAIRDKDTHREYR